MYNDSIIVKSDFNNHNQYNYKMFVENVHTN